METAFVLILFSCLLSGGLSIGPNESKCLRPNEVLSCVHACPEKKPEKRCETQGIRFNCLQTNESCEEKCVCKKGFYRNTVGHCISEENCVKCTGENEHYECGSACDNECALLQTQNKTNCPLVNIRCNDKCYCDDGYARDDSGVCVPIDKCPNQKPPRHYRSVDRTPNKERRCRPYEDYQDCKQLCPPDHCFSLVAKFKCQANPPCEPGCICKPGYLRKEEGSPCILLRECPELASSIDFNPEVSL